MLTLYQETVRSLLDQSDHPGVSAEELELFKSQFRTSAFTCRLKSCPRATLGFESEKLCFEHEMTHLRTFRCTFPNCKYPPLVSTQALKNHVNKYHNLNPATTSIRDIWVSPNARRAPASRNERPNRLKKQVQPKNQPMSWADLRTAANLIRRGKSFDSFSQNSWKSFTRAELPSSVIDNFPALYDHVVGRGAPSPDSTG
jgi:hypothetical protein